MPSNRPPEHARHVIDRIFKGIPLPPSVHRQLISLANSMELGKSELKGHLSDRNSQIRQLTREVEQLHKLQSGDGLITLYNSGATLLSKQADEIKNLKSELQRGRDEHYKLVQKLAERNKQISKVDDEKKNAREAVRRLQDRLSGLELGSPDLQANSNQELAKLKQRLEDYRKMADEQQKHIEHLTQENARLVMALGRQHFNELDLP